MKLLLVTGGTGGHIYPALALADYIRKERNADILFIGNDDRMEKDIIPEQGYAFRSLHTSGFSGNVLHKVVAATQGIRAISKAKKILKEFQPDVVIGFGGYVSAPVIYAAYTLKIPILLHEQNSVAGAANKMVEKYADAIIVCYEKAKQDFRNKNIYLYGNPRASVAVQNNFNEVYFRSLGLDKKKKCALIVMGSLGSSSVNALMKDVLKEIPEVDFLYVSGKQEYQNVKEQFKAPNIKVVDYVNQLEILAGFDLIIARAGATTAAEITAQGICSILIPSPYVAHNHQLYNAKCLVEKNAAVMIEEKDLNSKSLYDKINMILKNPEIQKEMSEKAREQSFPNACKDILDLIETI